MHIHKGKNAKERDVDLPKSARDALIAWLKLRAELPIDHKAIFVDLRGTYTRLSLCVQCKRRLWKLVSVPVDRPNPPVSVSPYILRHTFLYMLPRAGINVEIQRVKAALDDAITLYNYNLKYHTVLLPSSQ